MFKKILIAIFSIILCINQSLSVPSSRSSDSCPRCVCGVRGRTNRIIGGSETTPHHFPWLVSLWRQGKFYCGATIISSNFLVTAAHCLYGFDTKGIKIYVGAHEVKVDFQQIRKIKNAYDHEDFDIVSFNNDIAVIELDKPLQFNSHVQPACLPDEDVTDYSGVMTLVAGWGRLTEKGQTSPVLRSVVIPVWSDEQCHQSGYGNKRITDNMMCGGYEEGGIDACQGDSGGPMIMEGSTGSAEIIGVVSWGRGCARPNLPGIYTKIVNYLPWIFEKIGNECLCIPKDGERSNFIENLADDDDF